MKATLLEQMKRDYIHIKQTKAVTREQVERQEEVILLNGNAHFGALLNHYKCAMYVSMLNINDCELIDCS